MRSCSPIRRLRLALTGIAILAAIVAVMLLRPDEATPSIAERMNVADRVYDTNDPVDRGCALGDKMLLRIWRGSVEGRSPDVVMVPQYPNYTGHSTSLTIPGRGTTSPTSRSFSTAPRPSPRPDTSTGRSTSSTSTARSGTCSA